MILCDDNFALYAAKHYDNPSCFDITEFHDDLKRFKYIKRLFIKYQESAELKERLILNHIIILYNVFGDAATNMLFLKMKGYYSYLKPFLILINRMPEKIVIKDQIIINSSIQMDMNIVEILRKI